MKSKLILIMIDGISSDYFIHYPQFMPHTRSLVQDNTVITNMTPEQCGSSLPGRTSILTGQPSSAHGIYGNLIWDKADKTFRYATPYDVKVPTVFSLAKSAGLATANIGFGMIKPQDCDLNMPPHWVSDFVSRSRDNNPLPVSQDWQKALQRIDDGRLLNSDEFMDTTVDAVQTQLPQHLLGEFKRDKFMIEQVNALLLCSDPPDVIFTEINVTDSVQHEYGFASQTANTVIALADELIGSVVKTLNSTGLDSVYTVMITSDHGHGNVERAIYIDNVIPGQSWNSECAVVFVPNDSNAEQSTAQLQLHGAELLNDSFLPADCRGCIIALASKTKVSFEHAPEGCTGFSGKSKYLSSHSFYPGTQSDKRFAVIHGPHSPDKHIDKACANQIFRQTAALLELG